MITVETETDIKVNLKPLEEVLDYLKVSKDIELLLVDNNTIRSINKEHRGKDKATDVLSFPLEDVGNAPLGSIVISTEKVSEVSRLLGHSFEDELTLLFTHGLLHLLGYDHECDNGEMRELEEEVIEKFNLPNSLIVRSESV
jgi:probable rRNA maturation factor